MSIIEKAKDLGESIASSEQLTKLKQAEMTMQQDSDAQAIVAEFEELQRKFQTNQMEGKEISDEDRKLAEAVEEKMANNQYIRGYMECQREFEQVLQQINSIISAAISGQPADCGPSGCGPSCSSCN